MTERFALHRLSLANLTVGRVAQQDLITAAAAAGFGKVGLLIMTATAQPLQHELLGRPEMVREVKAALRDTGTRVFDIEAFVLSPATDLPRFKPALELGAEMGATHISTIGTELGEGAAFLSPAQRVDLFGRLCDEAMQFGLTVGVEFMLYRDIRTYRDALQLVEAAGRRNAGLILDILHFVRGGGTAADLQAVPAERIAYAQLCDCAQASLPVHALPAEARTSRLHLGDGIAPLWPVLDVLPEELQLVVETPVLAEAGWTTAQRAESAARHTTQFFQRHDRQRSAA